MSEAQRAYEAAIDAGADENEAAAIASHYRVTTRPRRQGYACPVCNGLGCMDCRWRGRVATMREYQALIDTKWERMAAEYQPVLAA